MADLTSSITETDIFTAVRTFLLDYVSCEVVRGLGNRVPMPKGDFIAMTQGQNLNLATPEHSYTTTNNIKQAKQFTVQIDCYGAKSSERAAYLASLFWDDLASQSFATSGKDIKPLYADDPRQIPLVNGEDQYEERWMFNVLIQYNPIVSIAQQSATTLTIGLTEIDAAYPPV